MYFKRVKKKLNSKTVFVGVSGGVDSSVSLALLQEAGYNVIGVFIRTWTPDFIECTWRDERRDAMRVCASLDVPFLECDAEDAYKKGVADYMIEEYKNGRTPNPDVMCNREVKFGVFWQFAKAHGADFIATGHYAQNSKGLKRGVDNSKDQSYFLWTLTPEDLAHTLFPIGHLQKSEVRKLAKKFNLPTAEKKDSQGVCFLGPLDMKDFLKHYIDTRQGNVETTDGEVIGTHDGVLLYTLGERHGFTITKTTPEDSPYYIVAKDINNNKLIVSHNKNENKKNNEIVTLKNVVIRGEIKIGKSYFAQVRYHGENLKVEILEHKDNTLKIKFQNPDSALASGQSVVIYEKDICIAGGVVI
jgi:tRNA-specific 2-thiouridylase